jgi:hypothetical protein
MQKIENSMQKRKKPSPNAFPGDFFTKTAKFSIFGTKNRFLHQKLHFLLKKCQKLQKCCKK